MASPSDPPRDLALPCDMVRGDRLEARVLERDGAVEITTHEGKHFTGVVLEPASLRKLRDWLLAAMPPEGRA